MLKKYLTIIIFSIVCVSGIPHDARGENPPMGNCCERCANVPLEEYFRCLGIECPKDSLGSVCPTRGLLVETVKPNSCCGKCIRAHTQDGAVNFESGNSYAQCIKSCKKMCPDKDTDPSVYQHLIQTKDEPAQQTKDDF